jgi:hypothetical protein
MNKRISLYCSGCGNGVHIVGEPPPHGIEIICDCGGSYDVVEVSYFGPEHFEFSVAPISFDAPGG